MGRSAFARVAPSLGWFIKDGSLSWSFLRRSFHNAGMFLLVPRPEHVRIVLGVLGRAMAELDFELYGYAFLSNHGSYIIGIENRRPRLSPATTFAGHAFRRRRRLTQYNRSYF